MSTLITERTFACKSTAERLWVALADTDRMNRAIGMAPVRFAPVEAGAARFLATSQLGPFAITYEERPFEWVSGRSFRVERRLRTGPAEKIVSEYTIAPVGDGAAVTVSIQVEPASDFARQLAPVLMDRVEAEVLRLDTSLSGGSPLPSLPPNHPVRRDAMDRALRALADDAAPDLVQRLKLLVEEGADTEVLRIRPFALADAWAVDRTEVLAVMLRAVRAGLLDLAWDLACPGCRTPTSTIPTLAELKEHGQCQMCEIEFALDVDEAVEVTFTPSPAIREVDAQVFCSGGPARMPHILTQSILPPAGDGALTAPVEPGTYRLFVRGGAFAMVSVVPDGPDTAVAAVTGSDALVTVRPGGMVHVHNHGDERHARIERIGPIRQGATARVVTSLAGFRRDFASDVLRPGASLKVSRVALLFSDLYGSTQLYSSVGDAAAFRLVHDHFDLVVREIENHRGAVVKTIGDAVMAVFASDLDAVAAAVSVLRAFKGFRAAQAHGARTDIKLGVHAGPCYVVTANKLLDYFGQSVNIAARLQGLADSGELVVDEDLCDRAVAQGIVAPDAVTERFAAKMKGVDQGLRAARIVASG